jgi:hypothetical protein
MKLQNTGLIIKSKLTEKFTTIPNTVLNDSNLSWKAKGILCKLLSNRSDWAVYKSQLQQFSTDGRDSTTAGFNELIERGYIVAIRRHNDKGQFMGWDYVVYDEPITEQPITENPVSVNPSLINTNIINTKEINTNTSIILGKSDLISKICIGLNITTKQLKEHLSTDFILYHSPELLYEYKDFINQYKIYNYEANKKLEMEKR